MHQQHRPRFQPPAKLRAGGPEHTTLVDCDYGQITLATAIEVDDSLGLTVRSTVATLHSADGTHIGDCQFDSYRRKRTYRAMTAGRIASEMDNFSHEAMEIGEALLVGDPFALEYYFNHSCLLVANCIEIAPKFRGGRVWKDLYFATMQEALRWQQRRPDEYFFKVFPIEYTGRVTPENQVEFERAQRQLRLLYAIHLDAITMDSEGDDIPSFMRAPVPTTIQQYFLHQP